MTRTQLNAIAVACGLLLMASVASANGVPDPRFSTCDPIGVGDNTGTAIGVSPGGFHVSVNNLNNYPILGATVMLIFAGTGVRAYSIQKSGTTVDVPDQALLQVAPTGSTTFAARTGGFTNSNAVEVAANGVVLGSVVKWRSTDIDGLDGKTGLGDFANFSAKYLAAAPAPECNFDLSASDVPGLGDLAIFAAEYLSGASGSYAW